MLFKSLGTTRKNIIEQKKLSSFHSRSAGLGEDSLCYEDSPLDCQGLTGDSKTSVNLRDPLTHFRLLSHGDVRVKLNILIFQTNK